MADQKDPKEQEIENLKAKLATAEKAVVDKQTELTSATAVTEELKGKLAAKEAVIVEKDRQIHGAGEIVDDLKKQVARAQSDAAAKDKQLEEAGKVVAELKTKLADPVEVKADVHGQVKHGKDTYELTIPSFNHMGDIITIEVLKERPKLVESLVADRVGFLRKVA